MRRLPGDKEEAEAVKRMIRVDHAGEYGALRIYAGQLAVMREGREKTLVHQMLEQEKAHFAAFDQQLKERRIRPTALLPIWHIAGFMLGAGTALLGKKAAFACTVAVESVIEKHYSDQQLRLDDKEQALKETITQFREEELEHHDTSIEEGGETTPLYPALSAMIKAGSRCAIWLSTRL